MPALKLEKAKKGKSLTYVLSCTAVFIYIISAIAFELTAETARISSVAIYAMFAVGVFFLFQRNKVILSEYSLSLVCFCLYVYLMCTAQNASSTMGMQIAYKVLTCVVASLLVFLMASKYPKVITYAMIAYIIGALILTVRLVSAYGGISGLIDFASKEGEQRVGGLMGNENAIGLFLATGLLCSLMFFIKNTKKALKVLLVVVMIALGIILLLTGSRKATIMAILGIILIAYFSSQKASAGKKIAIFAVIIALLIIVYQLITNLPIFSTIGERFEKLFGSFFGSENKTSYTTDMTRKEYISAGFDAFFEKPIFGQGTGYSYTLFGTYSHNNFVELLMNYGVVGFCLYYIPYVFLIIKMFELSRKNNDILAMFFLAYTILMLVLGIGWVNYYERSVQIMIALAFGYLVIKKREETEKNENKKFV